MEERNFNFQPDVTLIKHKAIKSVKWTVLSEIATRSIQPIVTLILARLLSPSDFGVVGVAVIAIGLAQIFQDFGLGKTLIQRETEIEASANIVFWTNLALSAIIYLIIFFGAPLLSKFFHESKVINVLRVLCLQIIIFSLVSVHQSLFQREFQFKKLFFIRLSLSAIPGLVSILLALYGYGVWALVFGSLTGSVVQVILFWNFSRWRPQLNYDFVLAKQLFGFSSWIVLEALFGWLIMQGDSIILGHFLGVKELGVYRVGVTSITLAFGVFFNPFIPISYSTFSRLQSNKDELKAFFLKMTKLMALISLPLGMGLAIFAKPISLLIFGQKWQGIEIVIAIIGIKDAIAWLVGINPEVYRAVGRPDVNTKLLVAAVIYYLPVYILVAPLGLLPFCIARLTVAVISMALHFYAANRVLGLTFTYIIDCIKESILASLIMGLFLYYFNNEILHANNFIGIFLVIAIGFLIYTMTLWLLKRELIVQFWRLAIEGIK